MNDLDPSAKTFSIQYVSREGSRSGDDCLAIEEPMEIRLGFGPADARQARSLSITMRTPGHDFELAAGFLFTEQIVRAPHEIDKVAFCGPPAEGRSESNIVRVDLKPGVEVDLGRLQRHFYTTSSCGICGKASLEAVAIQDLETLDPAKPRFQSSMVHAAPALLRASQPLFERTGGLHAAGLLTPEGDLLAVREDVGRHNAVDKLLGRRFLDGESRLSELGMVISGRASFEILQKALAAGVPLIVAVGAPSSLAVEMAERFGMTLIGFADTERFNVYSGQERMI